MTHKNRDSLRTEGEGRRDVGMALAAASKLDKVTAGKVALLRAMLTAPDGTATIDDATDDLAAEFRDGGKWRGNVTRSLAIGRLIESVGAVKSDRPSRHRGYVTRWRLADRPKAIAYLASLVRSLDSRLTTADALSTAQSETPTVTAAGASEVSTTKQQESNHGKTH